MIITDTGIVTIYDLKNDSEPLTVHRIDANEFLAHESGRWSSTPEVKNSSINDAESLEIDQDDPETMALKELTLSQLKTIAKDKKIKGASRMNKLDLIAVLKEEA